MTSVVVSAAAVQAALMAADEGYFHRRRGLPRWERIGHPLDTLTVAACLAWACVASPTRANVIVYAALAFVSCLFVTKDEFVHRRHCTPAECWLHALLFVVHPVVLACFCWAWIDGAAWVIRAQLALTAALVAYQIVYWSFLRRAHDDIRR